LRLRNFGGVLDPDDNFGRVANIGDLDNNGVTDLAVGAYKDDDGGLSNQSNKGAVWILSLSGDTTIVDTDLDGVPNEEDNCPAIVNPTQDDLDGDGIGDVCDDDVDGDGFTIATDCNDLDATINPGAQEIDGDQIDNDCDGLIDEVEPVDVIEDILSQIQDILASILGLDTRVTELEDRVSELEAKIDLFHPPDETPPEVSAIPTGGTFVNSVDVTLSATDNVDPNPDIYYTDDGSAATTGSSLYSSPIPITEDATLKAIAVDSSGNVSPEITEDYEITISSTVTITVQATDTNEDTRSLWSVLQLDGTTIGNGLTTKTYEVTTGTVYTISVSNYNQYTFIQWEDGSTENPRTFSVTGDTTFTALFNAP